MDQNRVRQNVKAVTVGVAILDEKMIY